MVIKCSKDVRRYVVWWECSVIFFFLLTWDGKLADFNHWDATIVGWSMLIIGTSCISWQTWPELIMDEDGCTMKYLIFKRRFLWEELKMKRVCPTGGKTTACYPYYDEGVLFALKKTKKKKISGYGYTAWHPFSSFMVNFKETKEPDAPEESQVYEVERDTFLRQMKEWGIKIEGTDEFQ